MELIVLKNEIDKQINDSSICYSRATPSDTSDTKNFAGATSSDGLATKNTDSVSVLGVKDEKYLHMEHKIILLIVNYLEELMMDDVMATGASTAPVKDNTSGKENL